MRTLASAVLLAALSACTPGTVNTVQPGAIRKEALEGEWYWRRTVADVPYGTAATFTGASDALERLRWKVEEDLLLGYRSYPHVDDSGASGLEDEGFYGAPLLAFVIEKQFDIRRGYDPATGEENNVVLENTEAPWYDREYLRVDWSANLAEAPFDLAGLDAKVLAWSSVDDRGDAAPQFDDSDGDGTIDSLMLTQRVLLEPDATVIPGYGDVPVCLFFGQAEYECAATEVDVVSSFVRVGDRAPVQGLAYDDRYMETFGFFETERLAYDRAYGLVEPNRTRYANRHPLWQATFETMPDGELVCADADRAGPCSSFPTDGAAPVEIPMLERQVRPIVYHRGPAFPDDLVPAMRQVAADWNEPLQDTVRNLRYWACLDDGGRKADCEPMLQESHDVFVFCENNPSLPGDPAVCSTDHTGPEGRPDGVPDPVRVGDLRYHLVEVVDQPQLASPYGYGPSAADPVGTVVPMADGAVTLGAGEIVSGTAFLYGSVLDVVSNQVADLVALLNGELSPDDYVDGENVEAWVQAVRDGTTDGLVGTTDGLPAWSEQTVRARLSGIHNGFAAALRPALSSTPRPTTPAAFDTFVAQADQAVRSSGVFGAGQVGATLAFEQLLDSDTAKLAWTPETVGSAGFDPLATDAASLDGRSPFDLVDPARRAEQEAGRVLAGAHAVDLDEGAFSDSSLIGLARHYASLGWTREQIVADVRQQSFREVMLHEVGHTLGLRHNFAGSFDALNFRPEYWDLRDDGHLAPRHVDPETPAEIDGRIRELQYSTIMDYPGSRNVGWAGLGHYDQAAIRFGYGELAEVFTAVPEEPAIEGLPNDIGISYIAAYNRSNVYPSVLLFYTSGQVLELHYTDYPRMVGDLQARAVVPLSRLRSTLVEDGAFGDGLVVARGGGGVQEGMPAVPYRFCSDEFAVGVTCARFDEGADPYEVVSFLTERYWNDYLLTGFARKRYGFGDSAAYVNRLYARTFEPLHTWERYYALLHGVLDAEGDPNVAEYFAADRGFGGWTAATDETFRFLVKVASRPEPGQHAPMTRADGVEVLAPSGFGTVDIPLVAGAYYESEWDFESGYHWFETQQRVGTYWDRMLALLTLTDTSSGGFVGYDTAIDPRAYAIGFQDLYRDPLQLVLAELLADEPERLGPARSWDGALTYPDPLDLGAAWPPAGTELVQPASYWLLQFDAGLLGKALLAQGYDRTFLDRSRLYPEGSGEALTPPADQPTVSFTDPSSGKTWTAWSFPAVGPDGERVRGADGEPVELGSSARLLRRIAALSGRCDAGDAAACALLPQRLADLELQHALNEELD